jgi:hypothetical protein
MRAATGLPSFSIRTASLRYWTILSVSPRFWRTATALVSVIVPKVL